MSLEKIALFKYAKFDIPTIIQDLESAAEIPVDAELSQSMLWTGLISQQGKVKDFPTTLGIFGRNL